MRNPHPVVVVTLALAGLSAQEQATSLLALVDRAAVVVHARAGAPAEPGPGLLTVPFTTMAVLQGRIGAGFALTEPAGRCCGRALFGVQPGNDYLLFLDRVGNTLHLCAGDRGLLEPTAALLQHVQALRLAATTGERAGVLAAALSAADRRMQRDAAHALAQLPPATQLTPAATVALRTALATALDTEPSLLPALLQATSRFDAGAIDELVLPAYLAGDRQPLQPLLRAALQQAPAGAAITALTTHWPRSDAAQKRAAALLAELPADDARPLQLRLLREAASPGASLLLCQDLLQRGASPAAVQALAPAAVLRLARQRSERPPDFRVVQPGK